MKDQPELVFDVNKTTNTIYVRRLFKAKLSLVWDAWTKPELLDQWWASEGWESKTKSMNFNEGGYRHYLMTGPEEAAMWGLTTYKRINIQKDFSGEECFSDELANIDDKMPRSDYEVLFHDQGENTLIEHATAYKNLEDLEASLSYGFEEGMNGAFCRLDNLLKAD